MADGTQGSAGNEESLLRNVNFSLNLTGRFTAALAMRMQDVAIGWWIYEQTRSPVALGLLGLAAFLVSIPLSVVTGTVIDLFNQKKVMSIAFFAGFCGSLALVVVAWHGLVVPVYAVVASIVVARAFFNPAGQAIMASSVPRARYTRAFAWFSSANELASMVGPAAGGLLYPLGSTVPLMLSCGLFLVATTAAVLISTVPHAPVARRAITPGMLVAGYRFIGQKRILLSVMSLDCLAIFFGSVTALLPIYAAEIYHAGPWALGILRSSMATGAIVMSVVITRFSFTRHVGRTLIVCVWLYGIAVIGYGLSTSLYVAMGFLVLLGAVDVVSVVIRQSLLQIETPNDMRGRVTAVHNVVNSAANNLGDLESGVMASLIGAVPATLLGGCLAALLAMAWIKVAPALWKRDAIDSEGAGR